MTTAALLAKLGRRVLVLEQHYTPGGYTHMFKRPHYRWDVGVHAVGEVTEKSSTGRLLAQLTDGGLKWASLGEVFDEFRWPEGFRIDFRNSPDKLREGFENAFPRETDAINAYLTHAGNVARGMQRYYLARLFPTSVGSPLERVIAPRVRARLQERTGDVITHLTEDERLRAMFAAQWGYYGSTPSRSSFAIQSLVIRHFRYGGYYPVGGASRIAEELLATVERAGGWTAIRTDVERIVVSDGRASGVRLAGGREIRAPVVVSAAGVLSTVRRLLPASEKAQRWVRQIESLTPAAAHLCLYLGFKGDIRKAGASPANKWFYETWDTEADAWNFDDPEAKAPCLYCSFPSLKDPEHDPGPEERHTGEVVTFAPWHAFAPWQDARWRKRGEDYETLKEKLQARLLEHFLERMPGLAPYIDHVELSTPASTHHFVRPVNGSIYGIEPTPDRYRNPWLRPRSPLSGLYFSGSDVATVGVMGAMMGGVLAAAAIEPMATVRFLRSHVY